MTLHALFAEVNWEPLEARRRKHRLLRLYKMFTNLSPEYLSSLITPTVNNLSRCNLRNAQNIQKIESRTTQYLNHFVPSSIREWNNLPQNVRNSYSVFILSVINAIPRYFYAGKCAYL